LSGRAESPDPPAATPGPTRGLPADVAVVLLADAPTVGPAALVSLVAEILSAVPRGALLVLDRDRDVSRGGSSDSERFQRLIALRALTLEGGASLVVSGRADLAVASGADGVQLPEAGLDAATVRRHFPTLGIGRSCHDAPGLARAATEGADWAILAPVWAPLSKAATSPPLGLDGFSALAGAARLPIVALGGVTPGNCAALRGVGARAVASLGGILQAPAPNEAAAALVDAFRAGQFG
jgi:thiamine-phosphate pyrophosphorylase